MVKLPDSDTKTSKKAAVKRKHDGTVVTKIRKSNRAVKQFIPVNIKNEPKKRSLLEPQNGLLNGTHKTSKVPKKSHQNGTLKPKKTIAKKKTSKTTSKVTKPKPKTASKVKKAPKPKVAKKKTHKATQPKSKNKNDRLKPRSEIQEFQENPFFTSKKIPETYVSPSVYAKFVIRSIKNKNLDELKKLINEKHKFPSDGLTFGYSYFDQRCPEMLAIMSGDKKFFDEWKKISKAFHAEKEEIRQKRPANEECLLRKMNTGRANYHMLGHATARIEMTRGGREGNNALLNYDHRSEVIYANHGAVVKEIVQSNPSFEMLDHVANFKDDKNIIAKYELAEFIHYAVRFGHRKLAGNMIKAYANYEFNQLHIKSLLNDQEGLGKFMPISVTKKAQNNKKITPIHTAAINPNPEYLKAMIPFEPNYNHPDMDNWTTIHYASVCEGPGPLKHLLDLETPILLHNKRKETPLHCAAKAGRLENLKLLVAALRKKKDTDNQRDAPEQDDAMDVDEEPTLKKSKNAKNQPKDVVTVQLNAKDFYGLTPLHMAVQQGHLEVVKFLLDQPEINVEVQTNAGTKKVTPLILACEKGSKALVDLLIDHGHAYIEQHDKLKRTPLSHATIAGHLHIVTVLLKRGASLGSKPDSSGNTAAHYAAAYGWLDILKLLAKTEPEVLSQPNSWHLSPFSVAYLKGHMGIVEDLLNGDHADKIDINSTDNDGCTLLMLIIKNQDLIGPNPSIKEQIEYLTSKGADASRIDSFSTSALHYFASLNAKLKTNHPDDLDPTNKSYTFENNHRLTLPEYQDLVINLLEAGAKLDQKNDKNQIPVDIALRTGNLILAKFLFSQDPFLAIEYWKNQELEQEDRRTNVLHLLVDLPFNVQNDRNVWSGAYGPMEEQIDVVMPIVTRIMNMAGNEVVKDWIKEYDINGLTPLHKLCQNFCSLSLPTSSEPVHSKKYQKKNKFFVEKALELVELLVSMCPESLLARTKPPVGDSSKTNQENDVVTHHWQIARNPGVLRKNNVSSQNAASQPILLNPFDMSLNAKNVDLEDQYYSYEINGNVYTSKNLLLIKMCSLVRDHGMLAQLFNERDHRDRTPLLYCVDTGKVDAANMLIHMSKEAGIAHQVHSAFIRTKLVNVEGETQPKEVEVHKSVLHLALQKSLFGIAENLVLTPVDLAFTDANGNNAMHYLSKLHSDKISKTFEQYKAAGVPLVANNHARYPLHYAVNCCLKQDSADILTEPIEWLLKNDEVGVHAQDEHGRTALHYAFIPMDKETKKAQEIMEKIDPISIVTLLVKVMSPQALKAKDDLGNTALHYAAQRGANICVVTLLRYNIDVDSKNNAGNTPLGLAVLGQHESVALTLIQAKADIGAKVFGEKPNPHDVLLKNRWVWLPKRDPEPTLFESSITSLVVRNAWQGIIYMIIDLLEKSTETILYLTSAAIEHRKYNLVQTLLRMLGKVKTVAIQDPKIFTLLAKNVELSVNDSIKNVTRMLFEAGIPWTENDGSSKAIEILSEGKKFTLMELFKSLDYEVNQGKNWDRMKGSKTAMVMLRNLIENWEDDMSKETMQDWKLWLTQVSSWCQGTLESVPIEFDRPAFDGMQVPLPRQPKPEKQHVPALIRAVQKRSLDLVKYLLIDIKVDINAKDYQGRTALMLALMENAEPIVYALFDPNFKITDDNQAEQVNLDEIQESEESESEPEEEPEDGESKEDDDDPDQPGPSKPRAATKKRKASDATEDDVPQDDDAASDMTPVPRKAPRFQFGFGAGVNAYFGNTGFKVPTTQATPRQIDNRCTLLSASGKTLPKKKTDLDLFLKDGFKNSILHYLVSPNGYENVTLLHQLFKAEPGLKKLANEPNSDGLTPIQLARNMKQFKLFKELAGKPLGNPVYDAGVAPETCPYDVDQDSQEFLDEQAKKFQDKAQKEVKKNKPNKNSGYAETGEIVEGGNGLFKVLMHKTDIMYGATGFHNFYRMELIRRKGSDLYILFTNWGRIGDNPGQFQRTPFGSLADAEKEWNSIFRQKSGNEWSDVANFEEKPNKYRLVALAENTVDNIADLEINLKFQDQEKAKYKPDMSQEEELYVFIKDISNVRRMQDKVKTLCSYSRISSPFGKFNREDLIEAKRILAELLKTSEDLDKRRSSKEGASPEVLLGFFKRQAQLTNDFYRHMPLGGFENTSLPMLDNEHVIKEFDKIVEQMLEFEIAGKIVTAAAHRQKEIDPFRYISSAIETSIKLLNPETLQAQQILQYIQNSSSAKISAIFEVSSKSSIELFKESGSKLHNHRYLWHGTKPENLLSILKLGLLATPPNAIPCAQVFGEGIYFADVFQKSQSYCTSSSDGFKYMLLCDVALGNVHSDSGYTFATSGWYQNYEAQKKKPMKEAHTLKVVGNMRPNPIYDQTLETGVTMPLGGLIRTEEVYDGKRKIQPYAEYNEYIVKDRKNINIRYLVRFQ